jgi:hypothetical protein
VALAIRSWLSTRIFATIFPIDCLLDSSISFSALMCVSDFFFVQMYFPD